MKKTTKIFALFISMYMAISCSNNNEKSIANSSLSDHKELSDPVISSLVMERGLKVYKAHCFACHQTSGSGIKGIFPPLTDNKTVMGEKSKLIGIILNGMSGEIEVKGEKYNRVMIPHNFLSDNQIADVLTYIRNSFGNQADSVSSDEVKLIRTNK